MFIKYKANEAILDDGYEFTNHVLLKFTPPYSL